MKKVLQFSGIIAFALALVGFILTMTTTAITYQLGGATVTVSGTTAIFGSKGVLIDTNPATMALIAWILGLIGLLLTCCGVVLPMLKIKGVEKLAGVLNFVAVACFVLAGVFTFFVVSSFLNSNGLSSVGDPKIGVGWVFGAIFYLAGGVFALLPTIMDFAGKGKKKKKK